MRRFLYLSPYFPPQTRVGALRPLKFARHLPAHGWAPVVLADLSPGDGTDARMFGRVPEDTTLVFDYSRRAKPSYEAFAAAPDTASEATASRPTGPTKRKRSFTLPMPPPEWFPLGEHSPDMWHARRAGRALLKRHDCEAIVVNADPYATCLVGRKLGLEFGLPVIQDLRDPWALCELRRPRRPALQRRIVDALERRCVEDAARFIVNSETALAHYRAHYAHVPPERFACIRNHGDPDLVTEGAFPDPEPFTLLFLGGFRRFVEGDVLVNLLAALKARGHGAGDLALRVSGRILDTTWAMAEDLGVAQMLDDHPMVPYRQVGPFMAAADMLVSLGNLTHQRIPSKLYDYATSQRPMLVVGDTPEIVGMLEGVAGVNVFNRNAMEAMADAVEAEMALGRRRHVGRAGTPFHSATAAASLAAILDEVTQ